MARVTIYKIFSLSHTHTQNDLYFILFIRNINYFLTLPLCVVACVCVCPHMRLRAYLFRVGVFDGGNKFTTIQNLHILLMPTVAAVVVGRPNRLYMYVCENMYNSTLTTPPDAAAAPLPPCSFKFIMGKWLLKGE